MDRVRSSQVPEQLRLRLEHPKSPVRRQPERRPLKTAELP